MFVTDTHPLVWYFSAQKNKLAPGVHKVFEDAVRGERVVWIPAVVLWELSLLAKSGKMRLACPLDELVNNRFFARAMHVAELLAEDVLHSHHLHFTSDPWDTMIVATALRLDCPLITKDTVIHREAPCPIFWS